MDTRQWISYGTVEIATGDQKSVHFKDEKGQPLAAGPIVSVRLHPSDITVACRIASSLAGGGEGSWHPISPGDEVIVAVPEGTERAGCVIIGRLGNAIDSWPGTVAGQDATENTFAFQRMRSPFILETAGSYMVRNAQNLAQFAMDPEGNIILAAGSGQQLVLRSDFASFALGDNTAKVQLDPEDSSVLMLAGDQDTTFYLAATGSQFMSQGTLNIGTGGFPGTGHAVTVEQVALLLANFACAFLSSGMISPAGIGVPASPVLLDTMLAAIFAGTLSPTPPGPVPGGDVSTLQGGYAALRGALSNPAAAADQTGFLPGAGRAGFLL